jgi:thioredoxin reductase
MLSLYGIKPEDEVLISGSRDTALMLALYLVEANVKVSGIVSSNESILSNEILVRIIKDLGIKIYLRYEIDEDIGERSIEKVKLVNVKDKNEMIIPNIHTLRIAEGFSPLTQLLHFADVNMKYLSYLGGFVLILKGTVTK